MCDIFNRKDARNVLANKHIAVIGGSNMRGLYKDLVWLINDDSFTPIPHSLARICIEKGHCSSSQSTFKSTIDMCGYTNFWKDTQICEFEKTNTKRPYFLALGNRTYFSVGKKPTSIILRFNEPISIHCVLSIATCFFSGTLYVIYAQIT